MSETKSRNILAIAAATVATGVLAYIVYFDYKRRNDAQFRRKLRGYRSPAPITHSSHYEFIGKEKKRVDKTVAQEKSSTASGGAAPSGNITPEMLRAALEQVKLEEPPSSTEEKEAYFMTQVGMGEQLAAQGMSFAIFTFEKECSTPHVSRTQLLPPRCHCVLQGSPCLSLSRRAHCHLPEDRSRTALQGPRSLTPPYLPHLTEWL